ncbi:MAG: 1-acyl-sn-glycerol-3-phosphate acyltransferase [Clostridia bacterium]|nr:1-acyl-sn-glycerol-3-phosphate acyltransferase [Clostridia bacterium]
MPDSYLVLANHVTDWDPLFVGAGFRRQMDFVASEHISRWKNAYRFLRFVFAPILRKKGTVASATVMEVMRKLRSGQNVCIFAEGARTWDGVTAPIAASTAKLVQSARCGLVTYRIVGGYFVSPNWSEKNLRRGPIRGEIVGVYTAEELAAMSQAEVLALIECDLHEDAYARQMAEPKRYRCARSAEQLENLLFLCPKCGAVESVRSQGDAVSCAVCGLRFTLDEFGMLHDVPFATVKALAAWQRGVVAETAATVTYRSPQATLSSVDRDGETPIATGEVTMNAERLTCGDWSIATADILDLTMHGRHAIVFSVQKAYYELLVTPESNALKFQLLFEALRNGR